MKFLVAFLILFSQSTSVYAKDGGNNGSWPDTARALLINLKDDLADRISYMDEGLLLGIIKATPPDDTTPMAPTQVSKRFLVDVIRNIEIPGNHELDQDAAQPGARYFYYDLNTMKIKAMWPYFFTYGRGSLQRTSPDEKRQIQENILLEVSHLWGFGNDKGKAFAKKLCDILHITPYNGEAGAVQLRTLEFDDAQDCYLLASQLTGLTNEMVVFHSTCSKKSDSAGTKYFVSTKMRIPDCGTPQGQERVEEHLLLWNDTAVLYSGYVPVASQAEVSFLVDAMDSLLPPNLGVKATLAAETSAAWHPFSGNFFHDRVDSLRARIGGRFCDMRLEEE